MARADMADVEGSQPLDRLGDVAFHHASEMQSSHHGMDRDVGKKVSHMRAHIDDTGAGARDEYNKTEALNSRHEHALVQEQRVGLPGRFWARSGQMIIASLLKRAHPRNL